MSTLALMRFLESAPQRYDRGMRWLTFGRDELMRKAVCEAALGAGPGDRAPVILEVGCGTGAVTARLAGAGARVTAIDQNPEMLELARRRLGDAPDLELLERTASEIDAFPEARFDAVVASFSLSEMSASERAFVLSSARRVLRPGGVVAIADEVNPRSGPMRALFTALRLPQAMLTWLAIGSVSHPIPDLAGELIDCGFTLRSERRWLFGHLAVFVGERPG